MLWESGKCWCWLIGVSQIQFHEHRKSKTGGWKSMWMVFANVLAIAHHFLLRFFFVQWRKWCMSLSVVRQHYSASCLAIIIEHCNLQADNEQTWDCVGWCPRVFFLRWHPNFKMSMVRHKFSHHEFRHWRCIRFHAACVHVISDIVVNVCIESGFDDQNEECCPNDTHCCLHRFVWRLVQYAVCTFSVVQCSILLLLVSSSTTIQWPCIVLGYTGRLVIQKYSATIEHWSCTTVQLYNPMWSSSRNENWLTTLGDSLRIQDNQNKISLIPPGMGLISSLYLT